MAVFEPLARLFVQLGITSPEAESLLRSVFVHVIASGAGGEEQPLSLSRAALLAGVHRNEVRRILGSPPGIDPGREARRHRANRILAAWHDDPEYTDAEGRPKELALKEKKGKGKNRAGKIHFWGLVERYAPGVWPKLILDELIRVGAVQQVQNQKLKVRMRSYAVSGVQQEAIEEIGHRVRDLLHTLVYNLENPATPRICETALALDVDPKWLPVIRATLQQRTRIFLTAVTEALNSQRTPGNAKSGSNLRVGLTVYSVEGVAQEESTDETREKRTRSQSKRKPKA